MNTFRLIATDLDGTLLLEDTTVSDRTRRSLRQAEEAGYTIILVTARPPRFVQRLAIAAELSHGLAICCNGALIYDLAGQRIAHHWMIEPDAANRVILKLRDQISSLGFAIERGLEFGWDSAYAAMPGAQVEAGGIEADTPDLCQQPLTKLIVRHPKLPAEQLAEVVMAVTGEELQVSYSGPHLVEIAAAGVHKAYALEQLASELRIYPEAAIAFGDMPNDLPMLEWAGRGVAVSNGHPRVLAAADEITAANTDDGVARVLDRLPGIHANY